MSGKTKILEMILDAYKRSKLGVLAGAVSAVGFSATAIMRRALKLSVEYKQIYTFECYRPDGRLRWVATIENLVVDEGLTDMLERYYNGSGYTAAHYVFLTNSNPTFAPGDTMATHPGWTENANYNESARPDLVMGTASNKSIDNSANKASYTINQDAQTIGGAGVTTDSTKSGATGLLVGGGAFTQGDKPVDTGDQLLVTVTSSNSSS